MNDSTEYYAALKAKGFVEVNGKWIKVTRATPDKPLNNDDGLFTPTPKRPRPTQVSTRGKYDSVNFTVPGQPVPKGRPRLGRDSHTYTPPRTKAYEKKVATIAKLAMLGRPPFEFSVSVTIYAFIKGRRRIDWDNIAKSITDAMNKIVYEDDSQIDEAHVVKRVGCEDGHVVVEVSGRVI